MITFHYTYIIMSIGFILTGHFLNLLIITTIIIIHELGHYITAKLLKFKVDKIIIYPFGGLTRINDLVNKDINEEILIATSGIIYQFIFYLLILYLHKINIIRENTLNLYKTYNSGIIFFNLLPIHPLDGSKILNLLLSKIFSYRLSNILTIIISLISIIIILTIDTFTNNYSYIMSITVLITYVIKFTKSLGYLYNKFLLERYLYNINYPTHKTITNLNKMYKNKTHIFKINNKYISEKKYLKYYFKWYTFYFFFDIII